MDEVASRAEIYTERFRRLTDPPMNWAAVQCRLLWYYQGIPRGPQGRFETINLVFWRLIKGRVRVTFPEIELEACPGSWVAIVRGMRKQEFSSDAYIESIHAHVDAGAAEWAGPPAAVFQDRRGKLKLATAALGEVVGERRADGRVPGARILQATSFQEQARIQGGLWRFFEELVPLLQASGIALRAPQNIDARVARSMAIIERWPWTAPWDRDSISRLAGISASQLDRVWRECRNQTPCQYWDLRRIRFAREKLENTRWSIKEIASELGFTHLAQFSNWFRCRQSMSPREYRERVAR
jgi:AraC-like DNA-binding protein